jgi:hypothetical protein
MVSDWLFGLQLVDFFAESLFGRCFDATAFRVLFTALPRGLNLFLNTVDYRRSDSGSK